MQIKPPWACIKLLQISGVTETVMEMRYDKVKWGHHYEEPATLHPVTSTLDILPWEVKLGINTKHYTPVFTAALSTAAQTWKQLYQPSRG